MKHTHNLRVIYGCYLLEAMGTRVFRNLFEQKSKNGKTIAPYLSHYSNIYSIYHLVTWDNSLEGRAYWEMKDYCQFTESRLYSVTNKTLRSKGLRPNYHGSHQEFVFI